MAENNKNEDSAKLHGTGMLENMHRICQMLMEKQKSQEEYQDKFNKGISEKLENSNGKVLEELQSIRNEMNGRKRKREDSTCSLENPAKKSDVTDSTSQTYSSDTANEMLQDIRVARNFCESLKKDSKALVKFKNEIREKLNALEKTCKELTDEKPKEAENDDSKVADKSIDSSGDPDEPISLTGKWFVLKHTFKDDSKMEDGDFFESEEQEHFGITWCINIERNGENLSFYTTCEIKDASDVWSIEGNAELRMKLNNGKTKDKAYLFRFEHKELENVGKSIGWGWDRLMGWEELKNDYLNNDEFICEYVFKFKRMTGIYKNNLRCFDESAKDCSDIVLIVDDKKFYVAKLCLASHSSYFKAMFLGMFGDSKKSEITLTGIDADDFQNYLEVLYGESAIDEYTVEGILQVADMYDTQLVIRKCEKFLLEKSKKELKKKLELSVRYHLYGLKNFCLSEIKSVKDIRSAIQGDIKDLEPSLTVALLEKSISFE